MTLNTAMAITQATLEIVQYQNYVTYNKIYTSIKSTTLTSNIGTIDALTYNEIKVY